MPYKIRNAKGLYSTGGNPPSFNKIGKTWSCLSHLKNHLRQLWHKRHWSENDDIKYEKSNKIPADWFIEEHGYIKDVCLAKQVFGDEK